MSDPKVWLPPLAGRAGKGGPPAVRVELFPILIDAHGKKKLRFLFFFRNLIEDWFQHVFSSGELRLKVVTLSVTITLRVELLLRILIFLE
jgi:hypothetical protein